MATHAGERPAVAGQAGLFVQAQLACRVQIDEIARVAGGAKVDAFQVAFRTAKGIVDLRMADEAVGHAREILLAGKVRFTQPAVAALTGIFLARVVVAVFMGAMVKAKGALLWRFFGQPACVYLARLPAVVAGGALRGGGQIPLGRRGARGRGDVTINANRASLAEMKLMGKIAVGALQNVRPDPGSGRTCQKDKEESHAALSGATPQEP
jgi:hypothetical protein